uniref:ankyrin repeat and zinc finger domain-containing protein 1-like isoform X1 n=1 Tax=Vespula vulgaris TaxID=7454 RepID=UPI002121F749|nr:ankyrin repeat and zinc finger domain-containing protein 1-like isoform X1 [Vespula vulgaris]
MDQRMYKIYNKEDFDRITKGIKVAQCMQSRSSSVSETDNVVTQLEELVVSDSLSCSFCNTVFEDKKHQRLHYKLDWHRYNLKQRLNGLKSISEDSFNLLADEGDVSSLSGSEVDSDNEDDTGTSETGGSSSVYTKNNESISKNENSSIVKSKKQEKKGKSAELVSDSSDTECNEEISREKKNQELLAIANRHSKVFFENDDGNIFSIYRCLLHNKKEIPEMDNEMIAQAMNSGKKTSWTIIMVGGGHFAAAVFQDGEPIVHKTFHSYTVRAKQGAVQTSRDSRTLGSHPKSAGASLRRYNEASLIQHVQEILELWTSHINNSSLILYRAVGPHNRTILFGGKNPPLDKNDSRLRPLPFPTRRATYSEVKRVYDILSTMEIYGSAADFTDCFPISPRQPPRKKISKSDLLVEVPEEEINSSSNINVTNDINSFKNNEKFKTTVQASPERQHRNSRAHIDRAKPRKSPCRPLPDIVIKLALTSAESETSENNSCTDNRVDMPLIEHNMEIDFREHLLAFQDTVPRYMKNKKTRKQKKKVKKNHTDESAVNEVLHNAKDQLWTACELGDNELLTSTIDILLTEVKKFESILEEESKVDTQAFLSMESVIKLLNDGNEDGNTMLHLAAVGGHLKLIWALLEIGSNPCNKNKKLQTPYAASKDKETRNTFRRFMGTYPDKFNYSKSQIPGPLTDEIEQEEMEKKRQQRKVKREKEKIKKREFEVKKQEEEAKQRFLNLNDKEKRALVAENVSKENRTVRCFQCAVDITNQVPFSYNSNYFCSMPCLKEHRLHNKHIL